jgi:hypothetical protein
MYRLSNHANQRMAERGIDPLCVLDALESRGVRQVSGTLLHVHRRSRTGVVVDPADNTIVTVMRILRKTIKRHYSR